ncbi:CDP-glucose 4,6-dehydratase [Alcanivorax sp. 1008]|nr:CDP-glucose 4,6-dehydratase [Alcanivorax sp. 1008]
MNPAGEVNPSSDFWRGRRVLLTGHTGFKGGWLALWLSRLGAQVTGIALAPDTSPALYDLAAIAGRLHDSHFCDIRDYATLETLIRQANPEVVFHLAAQPLVRASYADPLTTFSTNVQGTANVLEALRKVDSVKVCVAVTTDKVYRNIETFYPYRESDPLGGHDPYSASKAASELVISCYRESFLSAKGVALASARAGNVIGGGDWAADRLLPDAVRAWGKAEPLLIRRPDSVRPWQHVLEPLAGYLRLAESMWSQPSLAGAYNFGPPTDSAATVRNVVELARAAFGVGEVSWGTEDAGPHEAGLLTLDVSKARYDLAVTSQWTLEESVSRTMNWYRRLGEGIEAATLCAEDIVDYENAMAGSSG